MAVKCYLNYSGVSAHIKD